MSWPAWSTCGVALAALAACSSSGGGSPGDDPAAASGSPSSRVAPAPSTRSGPSAPPLAESPAAGDSAGGPFERARRALFERREEVSLPVCTEDGACFGAGDADARAPAPIETRTIGVGGRPLLYGDDVRFLLDEQRMAAALAAVDAAVKAAPGEGATRRLLLQNDVWERFDSLGRVEPGHPFAPTSAILRRRVAKLLRALALTPEEARSLASNLPEAARELDAELGGIHEPGRWLEVRTTYRAGPASSPVRTGTRHDVRAGHRMAFRILVRMPDDGARARFLEHLATGGSALPPGTRLALLGSPLALTTDGDVLPTGLVTVAETRGVVAPPYPPFAERSFDVFEVDVDGASDGARLRRMGPEELIPMGATCAPTVGTLVPMRAACLLCHARASERLTGPMAHRHAVFELEPDPEGASRRVAEEKAGSSSMRELREGWDGP